MSRERSRRHARVFGDVPVPEGESQARQTAGAAAVTGAPLPAPAGLVLNYLPDGDIEGLKLYWCTIREARDGDKVWWMLWFHVRRETDGSDVVFGVPVNPGGPFIENGPGGKTWGLAPTSDPLAWQISPSINVIQGETAHEVHPGDQPGKQSIWHQTPNLAGVRDQPWMHGPPPAPAPEPESTGYAEVPMAPTAPTAPPAE